eukprot:CAMPEP_0202769008 /NCGR_PEP_ID=MMETSP1388-20130828/35812_1 /ASSEMBLY_ACC=CAM_ASM_000864 /TAXON_ID=37098 /ORGANISM="Isochrysis sp, Strain CCMP1244" /LENGTH=54 /DNA_ID=CAMNT_0049437771 /DNA_START=80 /DNA_END=241 /DNA_ORIENTATION=+
MDAQRDGGEDERELRRNVLQRDLLMVQRFSLLRREKNLLEFAVDRYENVNLAAE